MGRTVAVVIDERWSCGDAALTTAIETHLTPGGEDDRLILLYCRPEEVGAASIRFTTPQQVQHYYDIVKPLEELHRRLSTRTWWRYNDRIRTEYPQAVWSSRVIELQGYLVPTVVACREHSVDMLFVGSNGGGRLWRLLFSNSEALLKRAPCMVQVVMTASKEKRTKNNQIVSREVEE